MIKFKLSSLCLHPTHALKNRGRGNIMGSHTQSCLFPALPFPPAGYICVRVCVSLLGAQIFGRAVRFLWGGKGGGRGWIKIIGASHPANENASCTKWPISSSQKILTQKFAQTIWFPIFLFSFFSHDSWPSPGRRPLNFCGLWIFGITVLQLFFFKFF